MACDTLATRDPDLEDEEEETQIFEKHDRLLHGERKERKYVFQKTISTKIYTDDLLYPHK